MSNFEQSNFELSNFELSKFDIHPPPPQVTPSIPSDPHNFESPLFLDLYIVPFFESSTQLLHDLCLQILLISLLV